jgi:outer membrane protein assembly factor BamD
VHSLLRQLSIILLIISLSGCAWLSDLWKRPEMAKNTPEALYKTGYDYYQAGRYKRAAESFQRLKDLHPLSPLAILAEMGVADAHYSDKQYGEAELAYNDFMNLHPTNENVPYVLYQIGMCHYNQMQTIDRDQTETLRAKREFERLIARFPGSKFTFMAETRLKECRQKLADHEFYIGEFYFKQKKYKAAFKRFETISRDYANLGLDYKVNYYLVETAKLMSEDDIEKRRQEEKAREKEKRAKEKAEAKAKVKAEEMAKAEAEAKEKAKAEAIEKSVAK